MKTRLSLLFLLISLTSCFERMVDIPEETIGIAPIYGDESDKEIKILEPQEIGTLFKIYYKFPYIYAGEFGRGLHIIDNSDPSKPEKIAFLQILGNTDIAIKDNLLYANYENDLVAIDISDLDNIQIVHTLENVFASYSGDLFPIGYNGFFECIDPTKGTVIGWTEKILVEPQCWR
ncbi:MAG: hypothetical protein MRY78_20385 [Saprospiraceae bacterium]|nr:hypothetical protein [Saprospiraceae bacterium]